MRQIFQLFGEEYSKELGANIDTCESCAPVDIPNNYYPLCSMQSTVTLVISAEALPDADVLGGNSINCCLSASCVNTKL